MHLRMLSILVVLMAVLMMAKPSIQHEEHKELSYKAVTKEDICANRQVPIISVGEAQRLINELEMDPSGCPESYQQSFFELKPILTETKRELVCSDQKFKQIADYHFRYINPRVETYKTGDDLNHLNSVIKKQPLHEQRFIETVQLDDFMQEIMIPISLQQFFKAWALQVSAICKRNFVENIERAMQNYNEADLDLIDMHTIPQATGAQSKRPKVVNNPLTNQPLNTDDLRFSDLVYLPELEGELQEGDTKLRDDLKVLDLRKDPALNKLMHACKYRFAPVYQQLVMPIVRLTKLGYDYVGAGIDPIRAKLDEDLTVYKWKLITLICESTGNFDLVEPEEGESMQMELYDYTPMISHTFGNDLWIKGAEALRKELDSIKGQHAKGLKRLLFNMGVGGRKVVAFFDPHQFAWYRRNQNTLSSTLNTFSIASNIASILVTVSGG